MTALLTIYILQVKSSGITITKSKIIKVNSNIRWIATK